MREYVNNRNPLLPLEYHTPDCEAHVMPDGRLYLYGSLDVCRSVYCSEQYVVSSTGDLKQWRISDPVFSGEDVPWYWKETEKYKHGEMKSAFMEKIEAATEKDEVDAALSPEEAKKRPLLFAPDCAYKDGKYYLYFCMADNSEGVAVSETPDGAFRLLQRMSCYEIDPAIFVDHDGSAYYYWGQFHLNGVRLNSDMVSFSPEEVKHNILTEEEHYFHEGVSVRRIGDTYYAVFADIERGRPTALGYATSHSPLGPFQYRGILIDNDGCDPKTWNNHGSVECFQGQWYVFYHRSSRNSQVFRRVCAEPILIREDGSIPEVKMTSQGIGNAYGPGERIPAYQACELHGTLYLGCEDACSFDERLTEIADEDEAIFRYVESRQGYRKISVEAEGTGTLDIFLDQNLAGTIRIEDGHQQNDRIQAEAGCYTLRLRFRGTEHLEVYAITLC